MENIFTGFDLPEEVKTKLTERIEANKKEWMEAAKNDPDFIGSLRSEEAGKFFKSQEKAYKKVFPDLNLDEIEGNGLARMEAILKAGVATIQQSKDATNQELQDKYLELSNKFNHYKDEEVPKILNEQKSKYHTRYIEDGILKDSLDFDTVCKAEVRPSLVDAYIHRNGWRKTWDEEAGNYKIVTKDNLKPTKEDRPLTNKEIIQLALDDAGVLQKSNGNGDKDRQEQNVNRKPGNKYGDLAQRMLNTTRVEGVTAG